MVNKILLLLEHYEINLGGDRRRTNVSDMKGEGLGNLGTKTKVHN